MIFRQTSELQATSPGGLRTSIARRLATFVVLLGIGIMPAVAKADTNETAPTDPNFAASGSITVGDLNACYILESTAVKCWGYNDAGAVGDGTFNNATTPQDVVGLTGVTALSIGDAGCAIVTGGGLKCWGTAFTNGSANSDISIPTDVPGLTSGVASVSVGDGTVCVVLTTGALKCWGRNMRGQNGDGTQIASMTPVQVTGLTTGVAAVSAGAWHTCALLTTGSVKCWGEGSSGQLGDNSNSSTQRTTPVQVTGLTSGVTAISAGAEFTCALLSTGAVKCWGRGDDGQIGDGQNLFTAVPTQVSGLTSGVTAISAGTSHACALMSTGAVKCWGRNADGELGDGTTTNSNIPVDVIGLDAPAKAVTVGVGQTCVLLGTNEVRCFGANYYGGLGNGTEDSSSTPVRVIGLAPTTTTTTTTVAGASGAGAGAGAPTLPATGSSSDSILAVAIAMLMIGSVISARRRINS